MEVRYLIDRAARQHKQNIAIIVPDEEKLSFQQLNDRANRLAQGLISLGLRKGDRVAVLLPNCEEYLESYLALAKSGLVRVSLNVRLSAREHAFMLADSGSRAIITNEDFSGYLSNVKDELNELKWIISLSPVRGGEELSYEDLISESSSEEVKIPLDSEDVFRLHYTSGTTGRTKGAIQTHASRVTTTLNTLLDVVTLGKEDKILHVAPLTHASGNLFLPAFVRGASNVLLRKFDPQLFLETVEREEITVVFLAPTMIIRLLNFSDLKRYDLSTLHTVIYGGAPMPEEKIREALQKLGEKFVQLYGLAEATWACTILPKDDHDLKVTGRLKSIGREISNVQIRLVDDNDNEVKPGEMGEIIIRGPHLMREYWNLPGETASVLRNGWLYTGDLARIDELGYLTVVDRKGEMIVSGGLNVYPKEVEDVLYQHPAILEAAVFGVPDEEWGESVKAVIVPKEGVALSKEDIISHCRKHLASYKKPRSIEFRSDLLPKSSAGKILRRVIREQYWQEFDRRVH